MAKDIPPMPPPTTRTRDFSTFPPAFRRQFNELGQPHGASSARCYGEQVVATAAALAAAMIAAARCAVPRNRSPRRAR